MTRDEAIKIQKRHTPTNVVDILADLGLLKLDEPKSVDDRLVGAVIRTFSFDTNSKEMALFRKELEADGLAVIDDSCRTAK